MNNVTIMDIIGSNNVEVSMRMKLSKATYMVLNNSPKILQVPIWISPHIFAQQTVAEVKISFLRCIVHRTFQQSPKFQGKMKLSIIFFYLMSSNSWRN